MIRFCFIYLLVLSLGIYSCKTPAGTNVIIPGPLSVMVKKGTFVITHETVVYNNLNEEDSKRILHYLNEYSLFLTTAESVPDINYIQLIQEPASESNAPEGHYVLDVSQKGVVIRAVDGAGVFYGIQSLLQMVWAHGNEIPCVVITDAPRFAYRGFHLDVSRHFFDKEFVKKQIDMMAYYKLNRFHWHLTDGAGWRIEIEKYPLLTDIAAWRPNRTYMEWYTSGKQYSAVADSQKFGGFYTKEDIKEVVEYAKARYITIIPEIEMPGHSEEVLAAYPHLSCSGKPYIDSDFCIGNEESFTFLEDVLTEVMALFPSEYIHIGGDEATKKGWAQCSKCKARMQKEGLNDLDELQNYMVLRIENFLNDHGRKLLGWDEILDGGLSKSATVMAWRGVESGIKSVKQGNNTIMTPDAYCYFDHYQDAPPTQPEAMPALLPLAKVYSFNPAPDSLSLEERSLIYGVQANLWTEYIPTYEHAEYMIYPRLLALAEVAWSQPENKSFPDFRMRALNAISFLREKGYHPFDLQNEVGARSQSRTPVKHKATGKQVEYLTKYHKKYVAAGVKTLTDGLLGDWYYNDGRWQGFIDSDIDVVIDMSKNIEIASISAQFMQDIGADIWMPSSVEISVSDDGKEFKPLVEVAHEISAKQRGVVYTDFGWQGNVNARYIRYKAVESGMKGGWLFTDEIVVN